MVIKKENAHVSETIFLDNLPEDFHSRFDSPVSIEGSTIKADSEQTAYIALGLNNIGKVHPLRNPH